MSNCVNSVKSWNKSVHLCSVCCLQSAWGTNVYCINTGVLLLLLLLHNAATLRLNYLPIFTHRFFISAWETLSLSCSCSDTDLFMIYAEDLRFYWSYIISRATLSKTLFSFTVFLLRLLVLNWSKFHFYRWRLSVVNTHTFDRFHLNWATKPTTV